MCKPRWSARCSPTWAAQAKAVGRRAGAAGRRHPAGLGTDEPTEALANAVPYLQAFGHTVVAWLWLDVALASTGNGAAAQGRQAAARYFFSYELPKTAAWLDVVARRESVCRDMRPDWF